MFDFLVKGIVFLFIVFVMFMSVLVIFLVFCTALAILGETTGLLCGWGHRLWLKSKREAEAHFAEMDKITV